MTESSADNTGEPVSVSEPALQPVLEAFDLAEHFSDAQVLTRGHIHQSQVICCHRGQPQQRRFLLQKLNVAVFNCPKELMENIVRLTHHLSVAEPSNARGMRLRTSVDGRAYYTDAAGEIWRVFDFIEHTTSFDTVVDVDQARKLGQAFGRFQLQLFDFDAHSLHETIPRFHDTSHRYQQFLGAVREDVCERVSDARTLIEAAHRYEALVDVFPALLRQGDIPLRAAHNDAKLDNVLFDHATGDPVCVIDLDTVMTGFSVHDFGDLIRTASGRFAEDEQQLDRVEVIPELFEAIAAGYLSHSQNFLEQAELAHLFDAARLITYETGLRFLTDYLQGDTYFRTHRPRQNRDRASVQFTLLADLDRRCEELEHCIQSLRDS